MSRELQLPAEVSKILHSEVLQFGISVVGFLHEGERDVMANARAYLTRITGFCRLLGARRAELFCLELEKLLLHCSDGCEQWAHARMQARIQNSLPGLLSQAVVQLQHFLAGISLPVEDGVFDAVCINELRVARGKAALSIGTSSTNVPLPGLRFPLQGIVPSILDKITTLQIGLRDVEGGTDSNQEAERAREMHLAELASVLEVCGLTLEMRRLPVALVHLELHFRNLMEECRPCTPERVANSECLAAADYLILNGNKSLVAILIRKLDIISTSLAETIHLECAQDRQRSLSRAARHLACITESIWLLSQSGMTRAIVNNMKLFLPLCVDLCRHISCTIHDRFFHARTVQAGVLLLIRVTLLLQKMLMLYDRQDNHIEKLARKISRECARFILQRQNELRRNMLAIHRVDSELRIKANNEITLCRQNIYNCMNEIKAVQGIHYVSETLCTAVSKLSTVLLVTGQIALHEIVEELRECLTRGLEQELNTDRVLALTLGTLCELLQRPLPATPDETCSNKDTDADADIGADIGTDIERQRLAQCIVRCATHMRWSCTGDETVAVSVRRRDDPQSRARVTVQQLPIYLAQNIRDLIFCTEELVLCAADPDRFEELNRRLIIELRMVATGASALHVHRVARLSALLAEVHQAMGSLRARQQREADENCTPPLSLLVTAHRQLRSGLNQAAARQEVSSNRDVIAALYQWLEDHSQQTASCEASEGFEIFHREAEEIISSIEEETSKPPENFNTAMLLNCLHTLKGNSRLFGANLVATLCHRCEQELQCMAQTRHPTSAVAESGRIASYVSGGENIVGVLPGKFHALVQNLRTAIDELSTAAAGTGDSLADIKSKHQSPRIPIARPQEHGIVIPAVSLQRMAELAVVARTGSRAMSDVLGSCRDSADSSRLSLLGDMLIDQERCTVQLDEEIAGSTRISFARVTPRLQRLVGRHANLLDRQLSFQVRNDDLLADRMLVESLVAPLEHLLRNAIDHGIEPVMQRRARGKPDCGSVTMALEENEDFLIITLTDDGAGIDTNTLPIHASRLGISVDLQAGTKERLQWLLLPGFSSRESATEDAGHGIGLAMVGDCVAGLGGQIEIDSVVGQGSSFRIMLPR